jgi:hypothetical protein
VGSRTFLRKRIATNVGSYRVTRCFYTAREIATAAEKPFIEWDFVKNYLLIAAYELCWLECQRVT